jgi:subtilase family serine protease
LYKWQVVSKNVGCSIDGAIQKFRIKELPDITVNAVSAPGTAFSGNSISVSWVVKNIGSGTTGSTTWYDYVYMSADQVWDGSDIYVGGNINSASLNPGQSYSNSTNITIPNGTSGKYYFIIRSDRNENLLESNEGNNLKSDSLGTTITLTPPPDLQVTAVTRPSVVFSGNNIPIAYTVKNKGNGGTRTSNWYDYIYLSTDSVFNGSAQLKRTVNHNGALEPDSQYSVSTTIFIPLTSSGRHFVYVVTDAVNNVYEHTSEGNNRGASDSMVVKLTPPPDLVVGNFIMNDTVSNNETVSFKYTISNVGGSPTFNTNTDYIFYSQFATFSTSNAVLLRAVSTSVLMNGDSSIKTTSFTMPKNINGRLYLHIMCDYPNNVFEGVNENNNAGLLPFIIASPNIVDAEVLNNTDDSSGKNTTLNWKISNIGLGKDVNQPRRDLIYIGSSSTFKTDSVTLIDSLYYNATIGINESLSKSYVVKIPNGTEGLRYFYVHTDARLQVFENGADGDNIGRGNPINVALSPSPDLNVISILTQDTLTAGNYAQINYSINNIGNKTATPQWKDRVYLSKDSVFNLTKCIALGTKTVLNAMAVSQSYNDSQLVLIPGSVSAGNYYVYVYTEVDNVLYEHNSESNNISRTAKIYANGYPPVDIKIDSITVPDSAYSGNPMAVSWHVTNIGEATTLADYWFDRIYLSSDSILDASDLQMGNVQISKKLQKDSSYTYSGNFNVPNGKSGMFYLLVKADVNDENNDEDTTNNRATAMNALGAAKEIKIILSASPDLIISSWQVPSTAVSGQPVKIVWTVKNDGIAATTASSWVDKIFLSTDYILDASDILLGSKTRVGNLAIAANYIDSGSYFIPLSAVGNFIVIIETDNTNRIYEHNAENNNTAASVLTVNAAPPADLIVTAITAPGSVNSGGTININYTVKNNGSNPASGYGRDNIYLSKDSIWDASDVLFKSNEMYMNLLPGISANRTASNTVSGVAMGQYYVIAYTDIRNNFNESNDTNNTAYSNVMDVNVPLLPLNTLTIDTILANKELYYRIEIADSLDGESILVQLKGDSIRGHNELFIRKDDVPSKSQFDYGYKEPFKGNQEIIIPEVSVGTYYIMATGISPGNAFQPISLFARKLDFEIRKVSPISGGNIGEVTLKIEGSKFEEGMIFSLLNDSLIITTEEPDSLGLMYSQSNLQSSATVLKDPTVAFVTFNLSEKATGLYDVSATKELGQTAVLKGGFTIADGIPPDIELNVQRPSNTRTNSIISFEIQYTNRGNVNLNNGKLEIVSNGGAAISFTPAGLSQNLTTLSIIMEETDGPSGVLRPKGNGSTTVYTNSSTALGFNILMPE